MDSKSIASSKVSIVIPLYNKQAHIQRALNSVLFQTYQDFEIIVVDDGSTDAGVEIVKTYTDFRIRLIHQPNAGPGAARNKGLELSTSLLITFLDADDEWLPTFLEESIKALQDHPDCKLAAFGILQGENRVSKEAQFREAGIFEGAWRMPTSLSSSLLKSNLDFFFSGSILCYKHIVEYFGGFYSKNRCTYGEDQYLWLQIILNHPIYRNPKPLVWYHNEASDLGKASGRTLPELPLITDSRIIKNNCPKPYKKILEKYIAYYALASAYRHLDNGQLNAAKKAACFFPFKQAFCLDFTKGYLKVKLMTSMSFLEQREQKQAHSA